MARPTAVESMSYAELVKLDARIKDAIARKKAEEAKTTKEALRAMAEKNGFSLEELFGRKRGPRGPSVVKYRDPANPNNTWTGRGRKPNWLAAALKKPGAKMDNFAV